MIRDIQKRFRIRKCYRPPPKPLAQAPTQQSTKLSGLHHVKSWPHSKTARREATHERPHHVTLGKRYRHGESWFSGFTSALQYYRHDAQHDRYVPLNLPLKTSTTSFNPRSPSSSHRLILISANYMAQLRQPRSGSSHRLGSGQQLPRTNSDIRLTTGTPTCNGTGGTTTGLTSGFDGGKTNLVYNGPGASHLPMMYSGIATLTTRR